MINREEYSSTLTKIKRVQKENEKLRESLEMVKREADHWEIVAKRTNVALHVCEAKLKLWKGTSE